MTRYALDIHPDDAAAWLAMTGRDESRPYDMPPLRSTEFMEESARRNGVRIVNVREIPEEHNPGPGGAYENTVPEATLEPGQPWRG